MLTKGESGMKLDLEDDPRITCIVQITAPLEKDERIHHWTALGKMLTHRDDMWGRVFISGWEFEPPELPVGSYFKVKGILKPDTHNGDLSLILRIEHNEDMERIKEQSDE